MVYRILVDGSGSMSENGKADLVHLAFVSFRYLLESGFLRLAEVDVTLFSNDGGSGTRSNPGFADCCDCPEDALRFSGTGIGSSPLKEVLRSLGEDDRILFLTDGYFDSRIVSALLDWQSLRTTRDALCIVRIGPLSGSRLASGPLAPVSFDLDELPAALDPWRNAGGGES